MRKFIIFIITLFSLGIFCRCNSIRQSINEKRDNKAFARVMASPILRDKITQIGNSLHPIVIAPTIIKGKDSIIYAKQDYGAIKEANHTIDSLLSIKCGNTPIITLDSLRFSITKQLRKSLKPDTIHRTDLQFIADTNCIHQYQILIAQFSDIQGQSRQKDIQINSLEKSLSKSRLWIIGISIFSILAIGGLCYLLFFKK